MFPLFHDAIDPERKDNPGGAAVDRESVKYPRGENMFHILAHRIGLYGQKLENHGGTLHLPAKQKEESIDRGAKRLPGSG